MTTTRQGNLSRAPAALVTAITNANTAAGADVLNLASGCTYTLTAPDNYWFGPTGLPPISSDITIEGNGATIETRLRPARYRLVVRSRDAAGITARRSGRRSPFARVSARSRR